jgi:hypothetical protein
MKPDKIRAMNSVERLECPDRLPGVRMGTVHRFRERAFCQKFWIAFLLKKHGTPLVSEPVKFFRWKSGMQRNVFHQLQSGLKMFPKNIHSHVARIPIGTGGELTADKIDLIGYLCRGS